MSQTFKGIPTYTYGKTIPKQGKEIKKHKIQHCDFFFKGEG